MKLQTFIFTLLLFLAKVMFAQDSSVINFSGFIDIYFAKDVSKFSANIKPDFYYNHKNNNQIGVNLAYLKANISKKNYRANFAFMVGSYAKYNLSSEPLSYQNLFEANVGVKISNEKNIWLDAGIMPSHIGFESAVSSDCWTLTRSILAENSPYFETGIKLSFINSKNTLTASLLYLNGWQNIEKKNRFSTPNFGSQILYKPNNNFTLNYSNFIGTAFVDSLNMLRTYHNCYAIYEPTKKFGYILGIDIGTQNNNIWYSPVIIIRKCITALSKVALRYEYYNDFNEELIKTIIARGFVVHGFSLNYDYSIHTNCLLRCELKHLMATQNIFINQLKSNTNVTCSIAIKF